METPLATLLRHRPHAVVGGPGPTRDRLADLAARSPARAAQIGAFCDLAVEGLARMYLGDGHFPFTMRGLRSGEARVCEREGDSLRYAIIATQGLACMPEAVQHTVLRGQLAADLVPGFISRAASTGEMGAVALAAWAAAEITGRYSNQMFGILADHLQSGQPVETVPTAWALTAALAARSLGDTAAVTTLTANRLLQAQRPSGLFPHLLPASAGGRIRAHIGCFADQVYPIQALARLATTSSALALSAANAAAARIVALQGGAGQWWWHYDIRDGSVAEGFPVYSVHQHAMAPIALYDLRELGGADHLEAVLKGVDWLDAHPETPMPLVSPADAVIWRKVGRREPGRWARSIAAVTTAVKAGLHMPLLDAMLPSGRIDYECRPYEFGWMLYAWHSRSSRGRGF